MMPVTIYPLIKEPEVRRPMTEVAISLTFNQFFIG
jgi:hypothetical protein